MAGGASPTGTVLLTVNPKHAIGTGCGVRDREKAVNYSPRVSVHGNQGRRGGWDQKLWRVTGFPLGLPAWLPSSSGRRLGSLGWAANGLQRRGTSEWKTEDETLVQALRRFEAWEWGE